MDKEKILSLEKRLIIDKNKLGLLGGSLKIIPLKEEFGHISERIDPKEWKIFITIDPDWNPENDKTLLSYARSKGCDDIIYTVAKSLLTHAVAHWEYPYGTSRGCPYNVEYHELILDATARALVELGKLGDEDEKHLIPYEVKYLANSFEDFCVNTNMAFVNYELIGGIMMFYHDQGLSKEDRKFTPFYEAFVKLQMNLFGTSEDEKLLSQFCTNSQEVEDVVDDVISDLGLSRDGEKNVKNLFKKDMWKDLAYKFAYDMGRLLEEIPVERMFGDVVGIPENFSPFDEKLEDPMKLGEILVKKLRACEDPPAYLETFETLDLLYQRLAAEIPLLTEASRKSMSFPIVHYGYETFDEEKHNPENINLRRIGIDENGKINFQVSKYSLGIPLALKESSRGFPDIVYIFDTSASMFESIEDKSGRQVFGGCWFDNSKYHYALLGLYGSLKYLQTRNIAPYIKYQLFNFSSYTKSIGPVEYKELKEVRKLALKPIMDETFLDIGKLRSEINKKPSVVIMISDGEIANWEEIKEEFRKLIEPHMFSFLRIGSSTYTSSCIERWGKPVYKVERGTDITKLIIDLTRYSYKPWLRGDVF